MSKLLRDAQSGGDTGHPPGGLLDSAGAESVRRSKPNGHHFDQRSELQKKLAGPPSFVPEEAYCTDPGDDVDPADCVQLVASVDFPTRYGTFTLYGFYEAGIGAEHTAIVHGVVDQAVDCPVRVHSECHTGDVWGSLRCDCRDQLEAAIKFVASQDRGAVVYLRQEGRGIGLLNKIKAYHLQDLGLDTVEANEYLGYPAEARSYGVAARILDLLGIRSVALLTNNPDKIEKLTNEGVEVTRRIPIQMPTNPHNEFYMETKREKMGHLF
ncbi:MAG: GTP cyclohydrolase II [Spirochaetaceae bacterium]|nr:MAG: GTP cyclohydrolase II [Spirochaetaceae bacterium]